MILAGAELRGWRAFGHCHPVRKRPRARVPTRRLPEAASVPGFLQTKPAGVSTVEREVISASATLPVLRDGFLQTLLIKSLL